MNKLARQKEAMKVAKWMVERPKELRGMFEHDDLIDANACADAVELLEKRKMEYLVPLFLYLARYCRGVDTAVNRIFVREIAKNWGRGGADDLFGELKRVMRGGDEVYDEP